MRLHFSHELISRSGLRTTSVTTRLYTRPWSAKSLLLDGPGAANLPVSFEVIDTSSIVDHYGHLSILSGTVHLLSRTSSFVLYTESLRVSSHKVRDSLRAALLMDVNVASLLFGLAPFGQIIGYTTQNNWGEDMIQLLSPNRYRTRLPWRFPSLGDKHAYDCAKLGQTIKIEVDAD